MESKETCAKYHEMLKEAVAAVNAGMPMHAASVTYEIPYQTLRYQKQLDRIDNNRGPKAYLTAAQENTLVQWVFDCSNMGMPVAKPHMQNSIPLIFKDLNRGTRCENGHRWFVHFLRRHEKLAERISKNYAITRTAATESGIRNWFASVERYLREKSLLNIHPWRVFSSETVLLASPEINDSDKSICVQITGNAAGHLTSPMIIFTKQSISVNTKISETMIPGWMTGTSEYGRVTAENFYEYIKDSFYPCLTANNIEFPVLLFLNGRVPHLTLPLTEFCAEHKIELIALPVNSSNLMDHPLETLFSSLNAAWEKAVNKYCTETNTAVLAKEDIAPLLRSTLDTLNVTKLLTDSFPNCGLYPLSVDSVQCKKIPETQMSSNHFKTIPKRPLSSNKVQEEQVEFSLCVSTVTHEPVKQKPKLTDKQFLEIFEQRMDLHTLQSFKSAQQRRIWRGRKEYAALFYFWKDAINQASNSCDIDSDSSDSRTDSTENHVDFNSDMDFDDMNTFEIKKELEGTTIDEDPLKICPIKMEAQQNF